MSQTFSLVMIKALAIEVQQWVSDYPYYSAVLFALFYGVICSLPMPFISVFTMLGGYFFGNVLGLLIVSFMSALGCTILFLVTRYGFKRWVRFCFITYFQSMPIVKSKIGDHENLFSSTSTAASSLSLRLIPGMPFSIPSIVLGLSQLNVSTFYWTTQLGLLPILWVYVNAGRSLSEVHSVNDIFSIQLVLSLLLLAIVPFMLRALQQKYSKHSALKLDHRVG